MKYTFTLFVCIAFINCYAQVNLDSGLVAWYPQSGNCNDYSGNGNHGTTTNCTSSTNRFGTPNTAYQLNGIGSQWEAPHSASYATIDNNDAISVSAWIYITGYPQQWFSIYNKYNTATDVGHTIQYFDGISRLEFGSENGGFNTQYSFQQNTWYHVVVTYSMQQSQSRIYINNNLQYSGTQSFAIPTTNGPMYVGYNPLGGDEYSSGKVDDLRFYNRVITPAEVAALYQSYPAAVTPNAVCQFAPGMLTAQGDSIFWYSDQALTNLAGTGDSLFPSTSAAGSYTYYAVNVVDDQAGAAVAVSFDVWPVYNTTDTVTVCQGDSVLIGSQYQDSTGSYPVTYQTIHSCDSVITTWLQVLPATSSTLTQTSCDSFTVNAQTYYTSGVYTQHFTNAAGCDSTFILNLSILQHTDSTLSVASCDSVVINSQVYGGSGIYYQTLQNAAGCDSLLTLNVQINYSSDTLVALSACDTVRVNSQDYTTTGIYQQIVANAAGCDSVITIDVVIHGFPSVGFSISADTICLDDADLILSGTPAGGIWTGNGVNGSLFDPSVGAGIQNIMYTFSDSLGCSASAVDSIFVDVCTGLASQISGLRSEVFIFPNPNNGTFTVQTGEGMNAQYIRLYDGRGRLAEEWYLNGKHGPSISIETTTKQEGVYLLEVLMQDGSACYNRLIITK